MIISLVKWSYKMELLQLSALSLHHDDGVIYWMNRSVLSPFRGRSEGVVA